MPLILNSGKKCQKWSDRYQFFGNPRANERRMQEPWTALQRSPNIQWVGYARGSAAGGTCKSDSVQERLITPGKQRLAGHPGGRSRRGGPGPKRTLPNALSSRLFSLSLLFCSSIIHVGMAPVRVHGDGFDSYMRDMLTFSGSFSACCKTADGISHLLHGSNWYFDPVYYSRNVWWLPSGHFGFFFTARKEEKCHRVLVSETSFEGELSARLQMLSGTKAGHCEIPEASRTMIPNVATQPVLVGI